MMRPADHLRTIYAAQPHERPAAMRSAVAAWAATHLPRGADQLVKDVALNNIDGLSRHDIRGIAPLFDDARALRVLKALPSRTLHIDALIEQRDPEAFLGLIADLRDGVAGPMGWWPTDVSPLLTALHLAQAPDVVAMPSVAKSDSMFLFIGASAAPHRLIPVRTLTRHRRDPHVRFARFALENPHLGATDRDILLSLMHPAVVADVYAVTTSDRAPFDNWLDLQLTYGSDTDLLNCLATDTFGAAAVAQSPRALRLALGSSLPYVRNLALAEISTVVPKSDVNLAAALLAANSVPLHDVAALVAACRRKPGIQGHLRV